MLPHNCNIFVSLKRNYRRNPTMKQYMDAIVKAEAGVGLELRQVRVAVP